MSDDDLIRRGDALKALESADNASCASCGHPRNDHRFRHPFVALSPVDAREAIAALPAVSAPVADRDKASKDAKAHEKEIAVWSENYAALEQKVQELVEALREIDALDPEVGHIGACSESAIRGLVLRMGSIARTAIRKGATP